MKTSEKPIWTVAQVTETDLISCSCPQTRTVTCLICCPIITQIGAKTRRRVKCTDAVGREKKYKSWRPGQEGITKIKGAEGLAERPDMSSIQAVELMAHLYHSMCSLGLTFELCHANPGFSRAFSIEKEMWH